MPTKKPVIQTVVEESIYNKFKEICNREDRSESKMAAIIIKQYIEQYERENGRISDPGVSVTRIG